MDDEVLGYSGGDGIGTDEPETLSEKEYRELLGIEDERDVTDATEEDENGETEDSPADETFASVRAAERAKAGKKKRSEGAIPDGERETIVENSVPRQERESILRRDISESGYKTDKTTVSDGAKEDSASESSESKHKTSTGTISLETDSKTTDKTVATYAAVVSTPMDLSAAVMRASAVTRTAAALAAAQVQRADDSAGAGLRTLGKIGGAAATAGVIGVRTVTLYDEAVRMKALQDALVKGNQLISAGKLAQSDLSLSNALLWKKLRSEGLTPADAFSVTKHKTAIDDVLTVRKRLKRSLRKSGAASLLSHVSSDAFFSLKNKRTQVALNTLLSSSKNGALRNAGKRADTKRLKQLLVDPEAASLSTAEAAAARMLLTINAYNHASARLKTAASLPVSLLSLIEFAASGDPNSAAVIRTITLSARGASAGAKIGTRITKPARRAISRAAKNTVRHVGNGTKHIGKATVQASKSAGRKTASVMGHKSVFGMAPSPVIRAGKTSAEHTGAASVSAVKASLRAGRAKAHMIARSKAVQQVIRHTQAAGRLGTFGARAVGTTTHILFTPVRLTGRAAAKLFGFLSGVGKWLFAAFGVTMIVTLLLIIIMSLVSSFAEQQAAVAATVMLSDDETLIPRLSDTARGLSDAQKEEAKAIGDGLPQNPSVFFGHTISRYGHPGTVTDDDGESSLGWVDGYKIYYTDIDGNINGALTSNIKDVLVLAYVMMEGDFDSDPAARDALVADLWTVLNPGIKWKESDIYTCPDGCDTFSYFCNSSGDYRTMDAMRGEGVAFYGSIHPQTAEGCDSYSESYTDSDGESHSRTVYFCDGHEATVCYGHKDIDIFIRIGVMADYYGGRLDALDPADPLYGRYLSRFNALGGFTEDVIDWCKTLYGADWFAIYGTDPVSAFGITTVETLSEAEVRDLVSAIKMGEGISGAREQAVAFAISQIGQIPYYWGGKATSGELPLMTNHGRAGSLTAADTKGRTSAGLDCYGFVQFVYWHALGMKIPTSSTSVWIANGGYGAREISASELKPGDMGVQNGHTGMFAGYENGRAVWVHCSGNPTNTVVMNGYAGFDHFYNVIGD